MNINEKSITKKIMIVIVIVMLCNFVMPNYSYAGLIGGYVADAILEGISKLLLTIDDSLFSELQGYFLEDKEIKGTDGYCIKFAPGTIFSGKIPMFDINFIHPEHTEDTSIASKLQTTIASWYNVMREISLVGLLSILVYIAIRIILSSASRDKAKYKKMLANWTVAICLVFTMHFIISITLSMTRSNYRYTWKICGWK